ncbi:MAG: hypothetical protein KDA87_21475, partial [Planctomycetales bacterium]|nr:hypothetical protein [Planctomycetales bacterium]
MSAEPNGLDFDTSNLLRSDQGVTLESTVASAEVTAKGAGPSLSLEERFDRLDQLCDRSRYLDAYELGQGFFGQELSAWPQMRGQRLAILLAKRLG